MPDRYHLGESRMSVAVPTADEPLPRVLQRAANIWSLSRAEWNEMEGKNDVIFMVVRTLYVTWRLPAADSCTNFPGWPVFSRSVKKRVKNMAQ
jgi:hypothetical protein